MNFLLISIDSWRFDGISRVNPLVNTPKFDCLTNSFVFADNFFSPAPATRPAHSSLLTGLYPFEHGLLGQGYLRTYEKIPNIFEILKTEGYEIIAVSQKRGVFKFLDIYNYIRDYDETTENQHLGSPEKFIKQILNKTNRNKFCFLHIWDTHLPYGQDQIPSAPNIRVLINVGKREHAMRFYYASVEHALEFIVSEILKQLSPKEWCVFILGDHGDGFSREATSHGVVHEEVIKVPLLFHIPMYSSTAKTLHRLSSTIDIFPTILTLSKTKHAYRGYGISLIAKPKPVTRKWVLSESDTTYSASFLTKNYSNITSKDVISRTTINGKEIERYADASRVWFITNGRNSYIQNETNRYFVLRDIKKGTFISNGSVPKYQSILKKMRQGSSYNYYGNKDVE